MNVIAANGPVADVGFPSVWTRFRDAASALSVPNTTSPGCANRASIFALNSASLTQSSVVRVCSFSPAHGVNFVPSALAVSMAVSAALASRLAYSVAGR